MKSLNIALTALIWATSAAITAWTTGELIGLYNSFTYEPTTPMPGLVGIGCDGYETAIFHENEDEFPICEGIQRIK